MTKIFNCVTNFIFNGGESRIVTITKRLAYLFLLAMILSKFVDVQVDFQYDMPKIKHTDWIYITMIVSYIGYCLILLWNNYPDNVFDNILYACGVSRNRIYSIKKVLVNWFMSMFYLSASGTFAIRTISNSSDTVLTIFSTTAATMLIISFLLNVIDYYESEMNEQAISNISTGWTDSEGKCIYYGDKVTDLKHNIYEVERFHNEPVLRLEKEYVYAPDPEKFVNMAQNGELTIIK